MNLVGTKLEDLGQTILERMGLPCFNNTGNVRLDQINPSAAVSTDQLLEFDFLAPLGSVCLIGEITGRSTPSDVRDKYHKFIEQYNFFAGAPVNTRFDAFDIPNGSRLLFSSVTELHGFLLPRD